MQIEITHRVAWRASSHDHYCTISSLYAGGTIWYDKFSAAMHYLIYIYIYQMLDVVVMSVVLAEFALNNYGQIDYDLNAFRSLHEWVKVM